MNKATNRRALAVYLAICLLYVSVAFRVPEKLSMKRIAVRPDGPSHGMNMQGSLEPKRSEPREEITQEKAVSAPSAIASVAEAFPAPAATTAMAPPGVDGSKFSEKLFPVIAAGGGSKVEPRFFISIPITCYAIKEGWVDRDTLIFSKKDGQNGTWSKPLDILKQQDESGIKHLAAIIGKSRIKEFLRTEAVDIRDDLTPEDIMLGRGYAIEKKKLLSLYDRFVAEECNDLFPLALAQGGVVKTKRGFQFVSSTEAARMRTEEEDEEWRMPNLAGFPIKLAIDSLAKHTARIKVHGSGFVVDQSPKPFERQKGDSECAIYLREASRRMTLAQLLTDMPVISVKGHTPENVTGISKDSREVKEGFIFFATEKSKPYVQEAVRKGAAVIVSDTELSGDFPCVVLIREPRLALGRMAARFFGYPSRAMHVTGITGTNGKTTTSYLIESILRAAGQKVGVMGTISYRYDGHVVKGQTTTPESTEIQRLFSEMQRAGIGSVVMEVSSHALDQGRVEGIDFDGAIFTNLTHDHLDYHHNFEHYKEAKKRLFHEYLARSPKEKRYAILNRDDPSVGEFFCEPPIANLTYSIHGDAHAFATSVREDINGLTLAISLMGKGLIIRSPLIAVFNVANILAAALLGHAAGFPYELIREGLEALRGVPGRLERIENGRGIPVFVDYAHTPDALSKTLETLKSLCTGRLIVLFGCGGDRDKTKRPLMGRIASELADFTIITSDNPRREEPLKIIEEIRQGFVGNAYRVIENRREAIGEAIRMATNNDVLLVAGKGHEDYQIIGTEVHHFSDREVIKEWFHVAA